MAQKEVTVLPTLCETCQYKGYCYVHSRAIAQGVSVEDVYVDPKIKRDCEVEKSKREQQ